MAHEQALAFDPRYVPAWYNKAFALGDDQRYEEALEALERAITLDPHFAAAWKSKGRILRWLGRQSEAKAAERRAKELGD